MFGGVTILDESLSISIKKELISLIMGPLTQVIFLYFIYILYKFGYVGINTFTKFYNINILLLELNLLPILPLDGGKIINNILDIFFSYSLSHKISIFISVITLPILLTYDNKIIIIFFFIFLLIKNIEEIYYHKYRTQKLILERKLKYHQYKKKHKIKNVKEIRRNKNFLIEINGILLEEKSYFLYKINHNKT